MFDLLLTSRSCVQRLRHRIVVEETLRKSPSVSQTAKHGGRVVIDRTPSFYTSRSIVNLSGLGVNDPPPQTLAGSYSNSRESLLGSRDSFNSMIVSGESFTNLHRLNPVVVEESEAVDIGDHAGDSDIVINHTIDLQTKRREAEGSAGGVRPHYMASGHVHGQETSALHHTYRPAASVHLPETVIEEEDEDGSIKTKPSVKTIPPPNRTDTIPVEDDNVETHALVQSSGRRDPSTSHYRLRITNTHLIIFYEPVTEFLSSHHRPWRRPRRGRRDISATRGRDI